MKPYRVELTNCLVLEYKMHKKMNVRLFFFSQTLFVVINYINLDLLSIGS